MNVRIEPNVGISSNLAKVRMKRQKWRCLKNFLLNIRDQTRDL